jgi:hypothetical protein
MCRLLFALAVASCGSPHSAVDAAPILDGAADGFATDSSATDSSADAFSGSPGPVTMTVQRDGAPDVGVPVVFQTAAGTVIATVMTDSSGVATAQIPQGGTVTVIQTTSNVLSTYIGVTPPEQLTLVDYSAVQPTQTVDVTAPTDPGANGYLFNYSCGGPFPYSGPTNLPLACGAAEDVFVRAATTGNYIGAFVALDVPIINHAMSITGSYMPMTSQTFTVTNSMTTNVVFGAAIAGSHGLMGYRNGYVPVAGGSGSASTTDGFVANGVNEAVVMRAYIPATSNMFYQMVTSILPSTASFSLDLDSALLPIIASAPSYNFAARKVVWQSSGGAHIPDATFARLAVDRASQVWEWHVAAPYVAGELALPALPVLAFDYNPQPGDSVTISLEHARVPGGYAAIRPNGLSTMDDANVGGEFSFHIDPTVPSQSVTSRWGQ